ncbi:hypothetical protein BH10PSE2_BH10PSE2_28420 [soil metagenome]
MSDAFSFMFAFYGLLLGLALAELAAGFSRAYDERKRRRLGVIAPLFAVLLFIDLTTFWTNAWAYRDLKDVTYEVGFAVAIVAMLYYFAATQVFPKVSETSDLDTHMMDHRRVVIVCVLLSNLITQIPQLIAYVTEPSPSWHILLWGGLNVGYYGLLLTAHFVRTTRAVGIAIGAAILYVAGATVVFG